MIEWRKSNSDILLNNAEKFLLLIKHPTKTRVLVSDQIKAVGIIGSILLDLTNDKHLEIEDGKLIVKSIGPDLSIPHKMILEQIENSSSIRKIKPWIAKLTRSSRTYQKEVLLGLESKGIITMAHKSFLGIKYYKTRLINNDIREKTIQGIRDIIFNGDKINNENALILGLIDACNLQKIICPDKQELKLCKKKLKEIMKSDLISQGVDKVIKDMQAAVIGAIVASTVVVNAGSR